MREPASSASTIPSRSASQCSGRIDPAGESGCSSRPVQRLVGVDVADPGDPRLVEQERLQRRRPARGDPADQLGREVRRRAARPRAGRRGRASSSRGVEQRGVAEAARVGEPAARGRRRARARPAGRPARSALALVEPRSIAEAPTLLAALGQQQVAGHPQVHDQRRAVVEAEQQVLAAPPDRLDLAGRRAAPRSAPAAPAASSARRGSAQRRSAARRSRARAGGGWSRPRAARARPRSMRSARATALRHGCAQDVGPRVGLEVDLLDPVGREVGVDLGRRDVGVAEHLLDRAQVAAAGEQVGGEAVAQRVRAHPVVEAGRPGVALDDLVEALPGERRRRAS